MGGRLTIRWHFPADRRGFSSATCRGSRRCRRCSGTSTDSPAGHCTPLAGARMTLEFQSNHHSINVFVAFNRCNVLGLHVFNKVLFFKNRKNEEFR